MSVRDGLRLAVGTLTAVPVPPPAAVTSAEARVAMVVAPLVVLPVAAVAALVGAVLSALGVPPLVAGLACVGALALATRAIHLDGLADTADGLSSGFDRQRALAVMRRGDVGPMGALALIIVLGAQASAAGDLLARPWGWVAVTLALAAARAALAPACVPGIPPARTEGLGAAVAGAVGVPVAVAAVLCATVVLIPAALAAAGAWWQGPLAAALAAVVVGWLLRRAVRRLGGITGDVLGALVEAAAAVLLVTLAAG